MSARIVEQRTYDAYCPECQWFSEGFDDEDDGWEAAGRHNAEKHSTSSLVTPKTEPKAGN